jgi:hypothetical protein
LVPFSINLAFSNIKRQITSRLKANFAGRYHKINLRIFTIEILITIYQAHSYFRRPLIQNLRTNFHFAWHRQEQKAIKQQQTLAVVALIEARSLRYAAKDILQFSNFSSWNKLNAERLKRATRLISRWNFRHRLSPSLMSNSILLRNAKNAACVWRL